MLCIIRWYETMVTKTYDSSCFHQRKREVCPERTLTKGWVCVQTVILRDGVGVGVGWRREWEWEWGRSSLRRPSVFLSLPLFPHQTLFSPVPCSPSSLLLSPSPLLLLTSLLLNFAWSTSFSNNVPQSPNTSVLSLLSICLSSFASHLSLSLSLLYLLSSSYSPVPTLSPPLFFHSFFLHLSFFLLLFFQLQSVSSSVSQEVHYQALNKRWHW